MSFELETPKQLAERVGVSVAFIRHLIHEERIDHVYVTAAARNPKIPSALGSAILRGAW